MRKSSLVLALIIIVASAPAFAAAGDKIVRFGAAYSSPTGDYTEREEDPPYWYEFKIEADAALGGFVGFEWLLNDKWGFDATLIITDHDVDATASEYDGEMVYSESATIGSVGVMPLFLSAHYHFLEGKPFDLYAGPTVGYVMYGDLEFNGMMEEGNVNIDDDFGIGAVFGLDAPFGSGNWNFSSAIRYIKTGAEVAEEQSVTIDVDPWIIQVGVGYKF